MPAQFGYYSWLNSASLKRNLKYSYLFAEQKEEQIEYHGMALLLFFAPGKKLIRHDVFKLNMPSLLSNLYKRSFMYLRELFGILWYTESTCSKKLQYCCVSLCVKIMRLFVVIIIISQGTQKLLLNPYTWQILKIYSIPNPHRNHKEQFSEPGYFEKNGKNQNLLFSD